MQPGRSPHALTAASSQICDTHCTSPHSEDVDARRAKALTRGVDVVHLEREVPEESPRGIRLLLVPVVRQLDLGRVPVGARGQKDEGEAASVAPVPADLAQAELGKYDRFGDLR